MDKLIRDHIEDSLKIRESILKDENFLNLIKDAGNKIKEVLIAGGTVYSCGNGGSACDAMHFTEELVARYKGDRKGYRGVHFMDPGTITCWSNDYDYVSGFERQAETFCTEKDILLGISTSGNSENILKAFKKAKEKNTTTIALLGKSGGKIKGLTDYEFIVPSNSTERIQEIHIMLIHLFCEFLETNNL